MEHRQSITFSREDTKLLKAIAVILMLMNHLFFSQDHNLDIVYAVSKLSVDNWPLDVYLGRFGNICVPIFAFLGGYGTFLSCHGKEPMAQFEKLWKKLGAMYRQYWVVFLVFVPLCLLCGVPRVSTDLDKLFWNFIGLEPRFNREWWFFAPYVLILFFYPVLQWVSDRFRAPASEIMAVVVCNVFLLYLLPAVSYFSWGAGFQESFLYGKLFELQLVLPPFWMGCIFAKHDFLSNLKRKWSGNSLYCAIAALLLACCPRIRDQVGSTYDFLLVPVIVICTAIILEHPLCKKIRKILLYIGAESTFIWLTHTMYCFHLCPRFVYAAKYPVLIFLLLLGMCYATAKLLRQLMRAIGWAWNRLLLSFAMHM